MTVINKQTKNINPWDGKRFIISRQYRYVKDDKVFESSESKGIEEKGEIEITSQDEFQRKLSELKSKNQFLKDLAIQENREIYAQLIIQEL